MLPKNWIYPIMNLIRLRYFIGDKSTLNPLALYVDKRWLRKKKLPEANFTNLIPYLIHEPQGIQIAINAKIKNKNVFIKWISDNWNEIQRVMELVHLPEYWPSNLRSIDRTSELIRLQKEYPELELTEIIGKYEKGLIDSISSSDKAIGKEIQQFKKYVQRLTLRKRKTS